MAKKKPSRRPLTVGILARLLYEEFETDAWGCIEPWLFNNVAGLNDQELDEDARSLQKVLARVVKKLQKNHTLEKG